MEQCIQTVLLPKQKICKKIFKEVKSSIAMHNTSTQFADGGEFGFGGEVGISTIHFHHEAQLV